MPTLSSSAGIALIGSDAIHISTCTGASASPSGSDVEAFLESPITYDPVSTSFCSTQISTSDGVIGAGTKH